jgi:hypothetical protein
MSPITEVGRVTFDTFTDDGNEIKVTGMFRDGKWIIESYTDGSGTDIVLSQLELMRIEEEAWLEAAEYNAGCIDDTSDEEEGNSNG